MKALVLDGSVGLRDVPEPAVAEGDALVEVALSGICNTDLELVRGYMGFRGVIGHEMVGRVLACPSAPEWVGRRVAGEINLACHRCDRCARGMERHCAHRTVLGILGKDGCHAEQVSLPVANLHALPDGVSDEMAVFVEPLAAAFEILEQVHIEPTAKVAILGDGKLGLLACMVLAETGCALTLVGHYERKQAIARKLGARIGVPDGELFDVVVEATGSPEGLARAIAMLVPRGTLVLKSTFHGAVQLETAKLVIDEITVVGSRCGPFAPAIRALASKRIDPTPLLDAVVPLRDGVAALERASQRGALKVCLRA